MVELDARRRPRPGRNRSSLNRHGRATLSRNSGSQGAAQQALCQLAASEWNGGENRGRIPPDSGALRGANHPRDAAIAGLGVSSCATFSLQATGLSPAAAVSVARKPT